MLSTAALFFLVLAPQEDPIVMEFTLAGSPVGQNVYSPQPDGSFTSRTSLTLMGQKIESTLVVKRSKDKLDSFTLDQSAMGQTAKVSFSGGSYTVEAGGKKQQGKLQPKSAALFSNYHPQIVGTIAKVLQSSNAPRQELKVFVLDSLAEVEMAAGFKSTRKIRRGGKDVSVRLLALDAGPVTVEYPIAEDGSVAGMDVPVQRFQGSVVGYEGLFVDPVSKYPELSQPTHSTARLAKVMVPMRDGVKLAADIVRPAEDGRYPVILSRTPYGREGQLIGADWWAKRGYVVVAQDVRGKHDSEGVFDPFVNERKDGYDTIDWVAKQDWCNGSVGMIGGSYVGLVQWQAAVEGHPALKCIVPQVSPPDAFFNIPYDHGVFMLWGTLWWSNIVKDKVSNMGLATAGLKDRAKFLTTLPLSKIDDKVFGKSIPFFDTWLKKERASDFRGFNFQSDLPGVTIPALHISGWWDGDGIGTKMNWAAMTKAGRVNQWLIYGPWTHAFNTTSKLGDVNYGEGAILELDSLYLRWFDTWLKGKQVGLEKSQPRVKAFLTGANRWLNLKGWPDPSAKRRTLYLGVNSGSANGPGSSGLLLDQPASRRQFSRYAYDPRKVQVPKELLGELDLGGGSTKIELARKDTDVLVFRSLPLKQSLIVTGPIEVDLRFRTNVPDTDFFAMLVDVDPKGVMRAVALPGKIRAKYISGWDTPKLLTPGKPYRAVFPIWDTAHQFQKGHRIGLLMMSQMFPMYARNLNTGEPYFSGTKMRVARQTILHSTAYPSALRFYVLPQP